MSGYGTLRNVLSSVTAGRNALHSSGLFGPSAPVSGPAVGDSGPYHNSGLFGPSALVSGPAVGDSGPYLSPARSAEVRPGCFRGRKWMSSSEQPPLPGRAAGSAFSRQAGPRRRQAQPARPEQRVDSWRSAVGVQKTQIRRRRCRKPSAHKALVHAFQRNTLEIQLLLVIPGELRETSS